jgi:uncharacterized protein (DUF1697 family)
LEFGIVSIGCFLSDYYNGQVNTYIALFRGINVGGRNILPMKVLVGILEETGCKNIQTYIQSGNVIFRSQEEQRVKLAGEISARISESQGFEPRVTLLDRAELEEAVASNPYNTDEGKALHFFFLDSVPESPELDRLQAVKAESEEFKLHDSVFYLYAPEGIGRSRLAASVERCIGVPTTARNWNTVRKLMTMLQNGEG